MPIPYPSLEPKNAPIKVEPAIVTIIPKSAIPASGSWKNSLFFEIKS
ncbi:hypothetical protein [Spiroplasma ixodetis]